MPDTYYESSLTGAQIEASLTGSVRGDIDQSSESNTWKERARNNIGAQKALNGALPVASGGTGQTTINAAANAMINGLTAASGANVPVDTDYWISQYIGGNGSNSSNSNANKYYRRPMSRLWDYIRGKISSVLGLSEAGYTGNAANVTGVVAVENGGTGASTAANAVKNLVDPLTAYGSSGISTEFAFPFSMVSGFTGKVKISALWDYIKGRISSVLGLSESGYSGNAANVTGVVSVANGGTGAEDAAGARTNLGLGTAATADIDATLTESGGAADAKATGDEIRYLKNGDVSPQVIDPTAIKGVTGVMNYLYGILHGKTIAQVNSAYRIVDGNDDVYLFEKGFGFLCNPTAVRVLKVNKTTLAVEGNGPSSSVYKIATYITSDQLLAINKTGLHTLNFDYFSDGKLPNTVKSNTIPKTSFSSSSFASGGINGFGGGNKAFAPFLYTGTIKVSGMRGYSLYNTDGSFDTGAANTSLSSLTVNNKIVVLYSSDPDNATIDLGSDKLFNGYQCSCMGDSLTASATYVPYLAAMTGMTIKNCGVGGSRISGSAEDAFWQDARVNDLEGPFIVIMGGTNDANYAQAGDATLENHDTSTFFGAYNVLLSKVYYRYGISSGYYAAAENPVDYTGLTQLATAVFPNIILVTPPMRFSSESDYANVRTFAGYVKQVAALWGLPLVDSAQMQMNWDNLGYFFANGDYTHYLNTGRSKLGSLIAARFYECYGNPSDQVNGI